MWRQTMMTCRFCKESGYDSAHFVKYGVRHYAHYHCYLTAGKRLEDLRDWQIGEFPYRLIKRFKLDDVALAAACREEFRKNGDGVPNHAMKA